MMEPQLSKEPSAMHLKIEVLVFIWKTLISFSRENFWYKEFTWSIKFLSFNVSAYKL